MQIEVDKTDSETWFHGFSLVKVCAKPQNAHEANLQKQFLALKKKAADAEMHLSMRNAELEKQLCESHLREQSYLRDIHSAHKAIFSLFGRKQSELAHLYEAVPLVGPSTGKVIEDAAITASSVFSNRADHGFGEMWRSRLDNVGTCWCAGASDQNQYLEWDFGSPKWVSEVQSKGRASPPAQWVTRYRLAFTADLNDSAAWIYVTNQDGQPTEFEGNSDKNTVVVNKLSGFVAQKLRLHPVAWHGAISMRVEVLGYNMDA